MADRAILCEVRTHGFRRRNPHTRQSASQPNHPDDPRPAAGDLQAIASDDRVRVLVVTGAGDRAFCAGSDVSELSSVREDVAARKLARENAAFTARSKSCRCRSLRRSTAMTLGGGAEIALACDIRFMDETARIGFPEVKLGVFPGSGGVFRLPRVLGPARAYELLYYGRPDRRTRRRTELVWSTASRRKENALWPPRSPSPRPSRSGPRSP